MRPSLPPTGPSESDRRTVALAKTTRPNTAAIVPRERLFQRMDADARRRLVWICGPAGSGKTSLAASYVAASERLCLWYELDPDDEDEATFFHYFSDAVGKHLLPAGGLPPPIGAAGAGDMARLARAYFRETYARTGKPWVLVLDGFSPASPESRLYDILDAAVSQAPANGLVIVTSRDEPPPAMARLRVTGEMVAIDAALLELDPPEMCQVAELRGQPLALEDARRLHEGIGGWAAALVLVLEHAKLAGRLPDLPVEAAPRAVFDYLAGEVFERFDERMRRFLLRSACLRRMTPAIAQAITGEERATRLLLNLATNHYFVSDARWDGFHGFQFHPLMREFLLRRARSHLPEVLDVAHLRRAARVLREAGHTEDAVGLLLECEDWAALAEVAAQDAERMLAQGRAESLAAWIEALPAALLDSDPSLWLALARCRMTHSPRAARHQFEQAAQGFARRGDAPGEQEACIGVIECVVGEFDDLAALDPWTARVDELNRPTHATAVSRKARHWVAVAQLLRLGAHPDPAGLDRGAPNAHAHAPGAPSGSGDWALAIALALHGETTKAQALLVLHREPHDAPAAPADPGAALARALVALIGGDFQQALAHLDAAAPQGVLGRAGIWPDALRTAIALARGEVDAARDRCALLTAADAALRRGERAIHLYLRGWLAALEADALGALHAHQAAAATAEEAGLVWLQALARLGIANAQVQVGDLRGAQRTLRGIDNALLPLPWWHFARGLTQVALQLAQGLSGRDAIAAAFAIGREHGIEFAPGWPPQELAHVCALALDAGVEAGYARRLVRRQALAPREAPLAVRDWPWPVRVRALGGFEIERDGKAVEFSGKGPGRPLELLKVLLAMGGQGVRIHQLADALWPNADADYAHKSFTAALHRLRRLLECDEALVLRDGRLSLDAVCVWTDAGALHAMLQRMDGLTRPAPAAGSEAALQAAVEHVLALYRGPFLPDEADQPAYMAWREQLRARLLRQWTGAARVWEMQGHPDIAADAWQRLIDADPLFEAAYRQLMLCHQRRGDTFAAREVYERLRTTLSTRLRVMPSAPTQELYATLDAAPH
jgi:ATP/maltotriose-dependent transcriptional regulator MalT/DNA-binding SARP family transcriptional activator